MLKKIVVIGPESTGKSTLCSRLAEHFKTNWVPEFAREYLLAHGNNYQYEDLLKIAAGQIKLEENIAAECSARQLADTNLLFIDTDLTVLKVWSEFVFNNCENSILTQIAKRPYDLYLLCNTDLPWVEDELREYPDLHSREKLFHYYKDFLVNQQVPWVEISGHYEERFLKAVEAVEKWM